jgi:nuclear GTP-binding protein
LRPKPGKKGQSIPNCFPGKEELLNEMYMEEQIEREEKKKALDLKKANAIMRDEENIMTEQSLAAKVVRVEEDEKEKYGGLTEKELKEAEKLIDPESDLRQANINKKSHWRDVKKVIDSSEVIVYVLDARDPEGTRCTEAERIIKEASKKIVFVINRTDLVPADNVKAW